MCIRDRTTTDNLGAITATGYITSQLANIALIQNGVFEWTPEDEVLIYYSGGQGFFTYDSTTAAFIAQPASAGTLTAVSYTHLIHGRTQAVQWLSLLESQQQVPHMWQQRLITF